MRTSRLLLGLTWLLIPAIAVLSLVLAGKTVSACNVPVFRYALERWRPDAYEVFVFHREPLTADQVAIIKRLEEAPDHPEHQSNVQVATVDLNKSMAKWLTKMWDEQKATQTPWVVVQAPNFRAEGTTVWSGTLDAAAIQAWLESPTRQELTRRLMKGDSIVWLYLHEGKLDDQDPKYLELAKTLAELQKEIELPEGVGEVGSELFTNVPLKIQFSLLPLDRNDPAEQMLVKQLLRDEGRYAQAKGPLVAPIFGAGRVLDILSGEELDPEAYGSVAAYVCGACSCQVKDQNPGWDLLLTANWQSLFERNEDGLIPELARAESRRREANPEPVLVPIPGSKNKPASGRVIASQPPTEDETRSALLSGLALAGTMFVAALALTLRSFFA